MKIQTIIVPFIGLLSGVTASREKFYCEQKYIWELIECHGDSYDKSKAQTIPRTETQAKAAGKLTEFQCYEKARKTEEFCLENLNWVNDWYEKGEANKAELKQKEFGEAQITAICNRSYMKAWHEANSGTCAREGEMCVPSKEHKADPTLAKSLEDCKAASGASTLVAGAAILAFSFLF